MKANTLEFPIDKKMDFGVPSEVADGVFLLKMPIPFALDHINLWLLRDGDGWTIVDTGFNTEESASIWENVLTGFCKGERIHKIIVTHFHPDHVGMAGWLMRRTNAPVHMSQLDYLMAHQACAPLNDNQTAERRRFYQGLGLLEEQTDSLLARKMSSNDGISEAPVAYTRMVGGGAIQVNNETWEFHSFSGHSPEHICLLNAKRNIMISGDQVLPNISPNIGVPFNEPAANPLQEYLDSLAILVTFDAETLVLPSHGRVFKGIQQRAQRLMDGHHRHLDLLRELCVTPQSGKEATEAMFGTRLNVFNLSLGVGEALAHLNYLIGIGDLVCEQGSVNQYKLS